MYSIIEPGKKQVFSFLYFPTKKTRERHAFEKTMDYIIRYSFLPRFDRNSDRMPKMKKYTAAKISIQPTRCA